MSQESSSPEGGEPHGTGPAAPQRPEPDGMDSAGIGPTAGASRAVRNFGGEAPLGESSLDGSTPGDPGRDCAGPDGPLPVGATLGAMLPVTSTDAVDLESSEVDSEQSAAGSRHSAEGSRASAEGSRASAVSTMAEAPATQQDIHRLRRLLWIFGLLLAVLIAPSVVDRIQYAATAAKERAQYDVARELKQEFSLNSFSDASRLLANYVGPSVVNIRIGNRPNDPQGSGVIVDELGYIVTNYHVVERVRSAELQLSDGRRGVATVVGADPLVDLAVLKTEMPDLIAAEWGDSDELDVGEMVWALGSPFGLQKSITFGIVSAKERRGLQRPNYSSLYQEFLQTDAAVNPGNSGGPLVNVDGEIVGINTAIIGRSFRGISFSIPSAIARSSYEQLRKDGWVLRGYLGVEPAAVRDKTARTLGLELDQGVFVARVEANTPAEAAGIQKGDVILSWNGVEHSDPNLLSRAIAATPIGSKVPAEIVRLHRGEPKRLTLQVTVAARPKVPM